MQALGLGYSPQQIQSLLEELDTEAKNFFTRPLAADLLFVYLDAKVIQLKNERDQVQTAIHFLVIGVSMDATKELLSSKIYWGNEQLECWKQVLLDLLQEERSAYVKHLQPRWNTTSHSRTTPMRIGGTSARRIYPKASTT